MHHQRFKMKLNWRDKVLDVFFALNVCFHLFLEFPAICLLHFTNKDI